MIKFSKEFNVESVWFQFLYQLNDIDPFDTYEILFILNFFLNLTTNGDYYKRIENKLFCNFAAKSLRISHSQMTIFQQKPSLPEIQTLKSDFLMREIPINDSQSSFNEAFLLNRIDHYDRTKDVNIIFEYYITRFSLKTQKLKIQIIWFLDVLIRSLFEIVTNDTIKKLFLYILHDFIKISNYNLSFFSNDPITAKIILYFRYEEEDEIRKKLSSILVDILKNNSRVSHIRILTSILKYQNDAEEILKASNNLMIFEDKNLLKIKSQNQNLLAECFKEFYILMSKMVEYNKENFIQKETLYFSGNSSGMILKNFNVFPANNFSIICQIKFENLMAFEKKFIPFRESNLKSEESLTDLLKKSFAFIKPHMHMHMHMSQSTHRCSEPKKISKEQDKIIEVEVKLLDDKYKEGIPDIQKMSYLSKDSHQSYKPILFSLISADSSLDIYLEDEKTISDTFTNEKIKHDPKKILKIRFIKGEKLYEQSFIFEFVEGIWYDLVISCKTGKSKKNFEVFINGTEVPNKSKGEMLNHYLDDFKSLNLFSIGCNAPKFLQNNMFNITEESMELNDCFCGDLKNLLILDIPLNLEQSKAVLKKIKNDGNVILEKKTSPEKSNPNVYSSKNIIISLDDFSILADIKMGFDFVWFEIKNKNEIKFLELNKFSQEKNDTLQVPDLKKNFLTRFVEIFTPNKKIPIRKSKHFNDFKIYTKEVTLIEKSTFFETLFTLGNMEVLLYVFEIFLSKDNKLDSEIK